MKIIKKYMIFFILLAFTFALSPKVAIAATSKENDEKAVKNCIINAYELRGKSVVNKLEGNELKNYYKQESKIYQFEKLRYKSFENYLKLSNEKIIAMNSEIKNFNIIYSTNGTAKISLYEEIICKLLDNNNIVVSSQFGIPHEVTLVQEDSKWKIATDAYDESDITKVISPNFSEVDVKNNLIVPQVNSIVFSTPIVLGPIGETIYNRTAVSNYASTYWSSYNSSYFNYNSYGGDCANFASQCIHAGNASYQGAYTESPLNWWYNPNGSTAETKSSATWRYCPSQVSLFTGWSTVVTSASSLSKGDLIYYDWTGDGVWDHVGVVTSFDSSGNPLVTTHNTDHHDVFYTLGGAARYKFLHFGYYI